MSTTPLFPDFDAPDDPSSPVPPAAPAATDPPRLRSPRRDQLLLVPCDLEALLPPDHLARTVWEVVLRWDFARFEQALRARGSDPGRAAADPRLLVALWLYAATQNVASGRELARLCEAHDAYRWLCGAVSVNYHTLNDFRVQHEVALDDLLTQMLAVLTRAGVVRLQRLSQDGTRVRAAAGSSSFRRRGKLEVHLQQARDHLAALKAVADDPALSAQQRAARQRAAREQEARVAQALVELDKVEQAKAQQKNKPSKGQAPRASRTDPEARLMRLPDGGTRPAYNVQFASDPASRAIVGVAVSNRGSDVAEATPLRRQVVERTGQAVQQHLLDGGFVKLETLDEAAADQVEVFMPVPKPRQEGTDPHAPKKGDSPAVAAWRQRMGTAEAQAIYRERGAISETVNGEVKTYRGLGRLVVRGLRKVRCQVLWAALAYNLMHLAEHLLKG
jgi:transposase